MSIYAIGDIQGCYDPLQRLLQKINFDPAADQLWSCGDLVNRGGHSLEVLRLLHGLGESVSVTLGNHDLHLLAAHELLPWGDSKNKELAKVLQAPDRAELMNWLRRFPLATYSQEHRLLRVHAGVIPQWDVQQTLQLAEEVRAVINSDQKSGFFRRMYGNRPKRWHDKRRGWARLRLITNILTRLRFCDASGKSAFKLAGAPGSQRAPYRPWYRHRHRQTRDVRIAFGHWAALGLRLKTRYWALDSGCVWGGHLTALRLEDQQIFQVPGPKNKRN